jgi:hydrogenase maturation protein HypF
MSELLGKHIKITGIVQGVGFRPFVHNLAQTLNLQGWVRNTSSGVFIEVDGDATNLELFINTLKESPPPLARIDTIHAGNRDPNGFSSFEIQHSEEQAGAFQPISPDISICNDCLKELFDPADPRYRYPFINCTNCGPRFTIIEDIPYDRPATTMAAFEMCTDCLNEYENPSNRRFHAQPVACERCGPKVWLETGRRSKVEGRYPVDLRLSTFDSIIQARNYLSSGAILAIKGLGGFHLACDATNAQAVSELRQRKLRREKPFALMMPDLETVEQHCELSEIERELLTSRERPVVLLTRKTNSPIVHAVAPGQNTLGVMLPYTPLHYLLFERRTENEKRNAPSVLVFTSGNISEEPITHTNENAREKLSDIADAFLMHDREIHIRCDDSVARVIEKNQPYMLRRSRGYAPNPLLLPFDLQPILATGAELKNTFCLTRDRYAFLSHHIGDMENYETLQSFEQGITHFERLFRIQPEALAYDLHPNYLATRYARQRAEEEGIPAIGVQHHHAHIAACMAENGLNGEHPVIGVSFDGTGYGDDGNIWGGEFLIADYTGYQRAAHLAYMPLPGGDKAVKEPWRLALALLWQQGISWEQMPSKPDGLILDMLKNQLEKNIYTPLTSVRSPGRDRIGESCGRCKWKVLSP